jgi:hypothetical protein
MMFIFSLSKRNMSDTAIFGNILNTRDILMTTHDPRHNMMIMLMMMMTTTTNPQSVVNQMAISRTDMKKREEM